MRMIDADTLKAEFTGNFHEEWHFTAIRAMIDIAPTIEAEPVRYGQWERVKAVDGGFDFRCSSCRKFRFHNGEMRKKYKRCPNCGAKMDKEDW